MKKIEVVSDVENFCWRVRKNGKVLDTLPTKNLAMFVAVDRARSNAPSLLEIRRINGQFQEYRRYQ